MGFPWGKRVCRRFVSPFPLLGGCGWKRRVCQGWSKLRKRGVVPIPHALSTRQGHAAALWLHGGQVFTWLTRERVQVSQHLSCPSHASQVHERYVC